MDYNNENLTITALLINKCHELRLPTYFLCIFSYAFQLEALVPVIACGPSPDQSADEDICGIWEDLMAQVCRGRLFITNRAAIVRNYKMFALACSLCSVISILFAHCTLNNFRASIIYGSEHYILLSIPGYRCKRF